jgi:23S rRNA (guanosine2251-2'-O)-methyltransferase
MSDLIYGRRAVLETLRAARRRPFRLWLEGSNVAPAGHQEAHDAAPDGQHDPAIVQEILRHAAAANIPVRTIRGGLFDRLAQEHANAQGVALETGDYPYADLDAILAYARAVEEPPLLLLLDHLQDPQNLGALIRTAEAMGVHGIILPDRRAARITPAVTNASAGAVEFMRVAQVTNLNRAIDELKARNIWIAGLDSGPDVPLVEWSMLRGALAVVVGSEGSGLSRLTRDKCDFLLRLPMVGRIESLNAAVAGSIVLYLAREQRMRGEV